MMRWCCASGNYIRDGQKGLFSFLTLDRWTNIPFQQTFSVNTLNNATDINKPFHFRDHSHICQKAFHFHRFECWNLVCEMLMAHYVSLNRRFDLIFSSTQLSGLTVMSQTVLYHTNMCWVEIMNLHFNEQQWASCVPVCATPCPSVVRQIIFPFISEAIWTENFIWGYRMERSVVCV